MFEHKGDQVAVIFCFHSDSVVVSGAFENLGHGLQIDTHGHIAVSTEAAETFTPEIKSDEGDVTRVHSLEGNTARGAVKVGLVDQVFDTVHNLLQNTTLEKSCFEHCALEIPQ